MQVINGSILDITDGVVVHQVNCKGVFNAGLARQIRLKYPSVFDNYMRWYRFGYWRLGAIQLVNVGDNLLVCNLAGQIDYGSDGSLYTNYRALRVGLRNLTKFTDKQVYLPYGLGCGYGGGDWSSVADIISSTVPKAVIVKIQ
jgi:O-acetyl-ADP-ribose deacetylase (regulator of RNase III)